MIYVFYIYVYVCNMCIYLYFSYTYEIITMLPISKDIHSSKSLLSQSQLQGHMEKGTIFPHRKDWLEICGGKKKVKLPQILHESIAFELFHYVCDCMCFVFCQGQSTDNRQKRSEKNGPSDQVQQIRKLLWFLYW